MQIISSLSILLALISQSVSQTLSHTIGAGLTSVMVGQQAPIEVLHIGMGAALHAGRQHRGWGLGFPLHRGRGGDVLQGPFMCGPGPTHMTSSELRWLA